MTHPDTCPKCDADIETIRSDDCAIYSCGSIWEPNSYLFRTMMCRSYNEERIHAALAEIIAAYDKGFEIAETIDRNRHLVTP